VWFNYDIALSEVALNNRVEIEKTLQFSLVLSLYYYRVLCTAVNKALTFIMIMIMQFPDVFQTFFMYRMYLLMSYYCLQTMHAYDIKVVLSLGWTDIRFYYQSGSVSYSTEANCTKCKHSGLPFEAIDRSIA